MTKSLRVFECRPLLTCMVLLFGCSSGNKSVRIDLAKQDLAIHQHTLVVVAGPMLVNLEVGTMGKLLIKGLAKILEKTGESDFVQGLRDAGLIPRDTVTEASGKVLQELGWKVSFSQLHPDSAGDGLPEGICEEAKAAGADSALVLFERMTINVGATEAIAGSDLWGRLFDCPSKKLLWRDRVEQALSLKQFVVDTAMKSIGGENKTLADFLSALRNVVTEPCQRLLRSSLVR